MPGLLRAARARLTRYFLTGVLAVAPVALTIAIVAWAADIVYNLIGPDTVVGGWLRELGYRVASDSAVPYAVGFLLVLAAILALGFFLEVGARRGATALFDSTLQRIPLLRTIYRAVAQLVSILRAGDDERLKGMSVVMCRFGGETGTWALALAPSAQTVLIDGRPCRAVLLPTAPVPFGGALLFLPENDVVPAGISMDEFISVYMSMGMTTPRELCPSSA